MTIKTVYLAGGIQGLSDGDAKDWREAAKRLLPRSVAVLDPMDRDYRGVEDANVKDIVTGDLRDIQASDALIANCARPSWGTAMEIHYAGSRFQQGFKMTKVVAIVPAGSPVSPWLRFYTDAVVETVADAVDWVVKL